MPLIAYALLALGLLNIIATMNLGRKVHHMDKNLDARIVALHDAVTDENTVIASAVVLITGFAARLATAIANAVGAGATEEQLTELNNLQASVSSSKDALAEAVAANTPAADEPATDEPAPAGEDPTPPADEPATDPAAEEAPVTEDTPPADAPVDGVPADEAPADPATEAPADTAPAGEDAPVDPAVPADGFQQDVG